MNSKRTLWGVAVAVGVMTGTASPATADCYTVVVGKAASADGSVLLGHDEQNGGIRITNLRVIPRLEHAPGTMVRLERGGTLAEVPETYSFLWSENPGLSFSDSYVNEWGVAVVSDGCPTREDSYSQVVDGGIGYMLRRLVVQRARTAREGVQVAGELLAQFGYWDSGRTLVIASPNEAWVLCMVRGKHWVARRVPDDEVALVPNVHIIGEIDLEDTDSFLGSPDVVDYAVQRGWYDPGSGKPFSFRAAYNASRTDPWDSRQREGQYLVTGEPPDPKMEQLPFSVKPDHAMTVGDVISVLRHHGSTSLCDYTTQEGAVFQLRGWLPPEIGCIYWRASAEPCAGLLIPWYVGITETPERYYKPVDVREQLTLSHHFNPPAGTFDEDPEMAWWDFVALQDLLNGAYRASKGEVRAVWDDFETALFTHQSTIEAKALDLFSENEDAAISYLTQCSGGLGLQAADLSLRLADALRTGAPLAGSDPVYPPEPQAVEDAASASLPGAYVLLQNAPNPFNALTTIRYSLPEAGFVRMSVHNLAGQRVSTLADAHQAAGTHSLIWDGRDQAGREVASGIYVCRLEAGEGEARTGRMVLLR